MAWYYGTFHCGCEGRVNVTGPTKNRQWIADNKFENFCDECKKQNFLERFEKEKNEAEEKSKEMELPRLEGTEKQIAWANIIRQKYIDYITSKVIYIHKEYKILYFSESIDNVFENMNMKKINSIEVIDVLINKITSAKFYIDNRDSINNISRKLYEILDEQKTEVKEEKELEKKIEEEMIIHPEGEQSYILIHIYEKEGDVYISFPYDKEAVKIIKLLYGYKWNGVVWKKQIEQLNNDRIDRMAEAANKFLLDGFSVKIENEQAKEKAISGNFEYEHKNWIKLSPKSKKIIIENNYKKAISLPTAKYRSGKVYVDLKAYKEVEDFAYMFDYKFAPDVMAEIKKYKEEYTITKISKNNKSEKNESESDKLKEILDSSDEILDDLKD